MTTVTVSGFKIRKGERLYGTYVRYALYKATSQPANIPPFDLKVDVSKWSLPRNRTPPRPQSTTNQVNIVKQIHELESAGIIGKSQSPKLIK